MVAMLPTELLTAFNDGVPGVHRRCSIRVTHAGESLDVEPGRAKRAGAAKADTLDAKLADDVIDEGILLLAVHGQT